METSERNRPEVSPFLFNKSKTVQLYHVVRLCVNPPENAVRALGKKNRKWLNPLARHGRSALVSLWCTKALIGGDELPCRQTTEPSVLRRYDDIESACRTCDRALGGQATQRLPCGCGGNAERRASLGRREVIPGASGQVLDNVTSSWSGGRIHDVCKYHFSLPIDSEYSPRPGRGRERAPIVTIDATDYESISRCEPLWLVRPMEVCRQTIQHTHSSGRRKTRLLCVRHSPRIRPSGCRRQSPLHRTCGN